MVRRSALFVIIVFCHAFSMAQTTSESDYPWINKEFNRIQFYNRSDIMTMLDGWNNSKNKTFVVLHLGDSHLQNENFPNKIRKLIQQELGDGGIGLIHPFSIVNTYDASFYRSTHTGVWTYSKSFQSKPKIALGVRGMSAKTIDSSSTFTLKFNQNVSIANNILTIFCSNDDSSFVPILLADSNLISLLSVNGDCREYKIPKPFKSLKLLLNKTSEHQTQFAIYGMSLSNEKGTGAIWHNAGVGAAQFKTVLNECKYEEEVIYLNPHTVIIDFGGNDYLYQNKIPQDLDYQIIQVIEKARKASPNASIILTSTNEMKYHKHFGTAAIAFSKLIRDIAKRKNCAFWDWYYVSGGPYSMTEWTKNGYSMNDGIHLNRKGYELKASLLFDAINSTFNLLNKDTSIKEVLVATSAIDSLYIQTIDSNRVRNINAFKSKKKSIKKSKKKASTRPKSKKKH